MAEKWISDETEPKEADFRGIMRMHVPICKSIITRNRWACDSYLYVDLYAGRGHLEFEGRRFDGSPLIAREVLTRFGLPYEAVHFERDAGEAKLLTEALLVPASLLDIPDPASEPVITRPCQEGFPEWLRANGVQRNRFGLVFADPIRDEIPVALLNLAASRLPKVDLLSYVSATQYLRRLKSDEWRNGDQATRPRLRSHVQAVRKKYGLIRRHHKSDPWHFTFILWTDWGDVPQWEGRGFYRLDSDEGQRVLDRLDLTDDEHHAKVNAPLPFEEVPYRTYAEYLKHPRFLKIRVRVFERAAGKCERCGQRPPTEPHHLRYPPWGTFDVPENMIAVCHPCHCEIHGKAA